MGLCPCYNIAPSHQYGKWTVYTCSVCNAEVYRTIKNPVCWRSAERRRHRERYVTHRRHCAATWEPGDHPEYLPRRYVA